MKSILVQLICAALVLSLTPSCSKEKATEKTLYTCSMHPQVVQDHPGNCPICGMKLVPVRNQSETAAKDRQSTGSRKIKYYKSTMMLGEISQAPRKDSMGMEMVPVYEGEEESQTITVDPVTVQKMGVRAAPVTKGPLRRVIRTVGSIDYNETALADVTTKFRGWIENLYVDSTGKQVRKGEPLFDIYSPDLYSAQNEYVLALNQTGGSGLKGSALQKLKLFDISQDQIAALEKTRQPQRTLRIDAPIDGIVVEKMAVKGQMVEAGMKLYRLADLSIVWVQSQIYEQDLALLKLGQEAEVSLSYLPDRKFRGRVTYIYPTVDEKTRTARVRMEFHNPGFFLKPGMFATVELHAELEPEALLVPDTAVLRSGDRNTVFVALENGKFEPRTVTIGARGENDTYQVLSGLKESERVVTSGQFMLDSESQLREAIQKMLSPNAAASPPPNAEHAVTAASVASPMPSAATVSGSQEYVCPTEYSCPMPEHMNIAYNHPGKCPICGMTLIPKPAEKTDAAPTSPSPTSAPPQH
ncbi:MAG TPA: efflux RND transporter periplasmic adaptor subunit [Chthoniobacterales bacterium]|nr:efflux RND transporter periplasmic adaptor subunit [Chthoniobacterales bacterium]